MMAGYRRDDFGIERHARCTDIGTDSCTVNGPQDARDEFWRWIGNRIGSLACLRNVIN